MGMRKENQNLIHASYRYYTFIILYLWIQAIIIHYMYVLEHHKLLNIYVVGNMVTMN